MSVILIDGDGASDRADFLAKIAEGNGLVAGRRCKRVHPFLSGRLPSIIASRLISWITRANLHVYGRTLKAMRREIANELQLYGEMARFIPALANERGAQAAELGVNNGSVRSAGSAASLVS